MGKEYTSPLGGRMEKCPVCGELFLARGLKQHIIRNAQQEVWRKYFNPDENTPHLEFFEERVIIKKNPKFEFKIYK